MLRATIDPRSGGPSNVSEFYCRTSPLTNRMRYPTNRTAYADSSNSLLDRIDGCLARWRTRRLTLRTFPRAEEPHLSDSPQRHRARHIAGDMAMLVVGILIALAADAAWEGRQDRREMGQIVEALRAELERNREHLTQRETDHEGLRSRTARLAAVINGAVPSPPNEEAAALVLTVLGWTTTTQSFGAYDVLLARGNADGVAVDLLVDLAAHVQRSRQGGSLTDRAVAADTQALLTRVIREHGGHLGLMGSNVRDALDLPSPSMPPNLQDILSDPEFIDGVTIMSGLYRNHAAWIAARRGETEHLLAALN